MNDKNPLRGPGHTLLGLPSDHLLMHNKAWLISQEHCGS